MRTKHTGQLQFYPSFDASQRVVSPNHQPIAYTDGSYCYPVSGCNVHHQQDLLPAWKREVLK